MSKPRPIMGAAIWVIIGAVASMSPEKGRPIYRRLVDLSSEIAFGPKLEKEK